MGKLRLSLQAPCRETVLSPANICAHLHVCLSPSLSSVPSFSLFSCLFPSLSILSFIIFPSLLLYFRNLFSALSSLLCQLSSSLFSSLLFSPLSTLSLSLRYSPLFSFLLSCLLFPFSLYLSLSLSPSLTAFCSPGVRGGSVLQSWLEC